MASQRGESDQVRWMCGFWDMQKRRFRARRAEYQVVYVAAQKQMASYPLRCVSASSFLLGTLRAKICVVYRCFRCQSLIELRLDNCQNLTEAEIQPVLSKCVPSAAAHPFACPMLTGSVPCAHPDMHQRCVKCRCETPSLHTCTCPAVHCQGWTCHAASSYCRCSWIAQRLFRYQRRAFSC